MTRASHLKRTYGITEAQYDELIRRFRGRCGVCERPAKTFTKRLCVDHDHATGEIRGLLCTYCNKFVVGRHRKDQGLVLLENAARYLKGPYTGWFVPPKKKKRKKRGKNPSNRTR